MKKKTCVVLSGAGISAESGIQTFRGGDGLWNGHRIHDVATPSAWQRNPGMVLEFYNMRRQGVRRAQPNTGHHALVELEQLFDTCIITQNIDDLHERAGSTQVLHLHGEILKARSTADDHCLIDLGDKDIQLGDRCPKGSQLRPHVVWFGEAVPAMEAAAETVAKADICIVVGTSLQVYPAAGLLRQIPYGSLRYVVDVDIPALATQLGFEAIDAPASVGLPSLLAKLRCCL